MFLSSEGPLEAAARAADQVGVRWHGKLTPDDRRALLQGFFLAESLAAEAIRQASTQVPQRYREGLLDQAADEARHVGCFAGMLEWTPEVPGPRVRQRQTIQWFVSLLVNELTGYCQFRMLLRMLEPTAHAGQIEAILADEQRHIRRLLTWLEPLWFSRSALPISGYLARFQRDLPGRMCQFFPREDLLPLRQELVEITAGLLLQLPACAQAASSTAPRAEMKGALTTERP